MGVGGAVGSGVLVGGPVVAVGVGGAAVAVLSFTAVAVGGKGVAVAGTFTLARVKVG